VLGRRRLGLVAVVDGIGRFGGVHELSILRAIPQYTPVFRNADSPLGASTTDFRTSS
jgi:hypothetical protein